MIVVDTGAVLALLDRDDAHHREALALFDARGEDWVLPWAVLPEVDYLIARHGGKGAAAAFRTDLAEGAWLVAWGEESDLAGANRILARYADLNLGLVDAVVMAVAEREGAEAIATFDLRHFGAVELEGGPKLLPRDG
ncbi:MAG: type II toxin-antitoxin system VapC family toxin [Gemmatimonadota bacterium]